MKNSFEDTIILDTKNKNLGITNTELNKYIQFKLGKEKFEIEELAEIKEIIIDGKTFTGEENKIDFDEISLFNNLKEIEINNAKISEEHIQKLKKIDKITFKKCTIENLEYLSEVKKLSLKSSSINKLESIRKLIQIEELELIDLEIENFEFLKQLSKLKKLKIKNINNFEFGKISFYLPIEYLSVENIDTLELEDIQKFTNLKYLSIDREKANDFKEELEKIERSGVKILLNDIYDY